MDLRTRVRRTTAAASFAAGMVALLLVPALASAELVNDLLDSLGIGGDTPAKKQSAPESGSSQADTRGGIPGVGTGYKPPLHGDNPHGQGTVATIDLPPSTAEPVSGDPAGPELIVVGRSKGEQNPNGTYHGHITIVGLLGNEVLGVDTNEGQTATAATDPINTAILTPLCNGSANNICLGIFNANSSTTADGSTNNFSTASAALGGPGGINAGVGQSSGNISDDGTCQTSTSTSSVANATVATLVAASALNAASGSKACNDGTAPTTTQGSSVIGLNGAAVPIPPPPGCANGTPNTVFSLLPPLNLVTTVCNADDPGTTQAGLPYNVREALTVFGDILGTGILKATTAAAESRATAPAAAVGTPNIAPGNPLIGPGGGGGNNNDNDNGPGDDSTAETAQGGGGGNLAFTGAELIWIAMLGLVLVATGLAIAGTASAVRRPKLLP